jgi:hypothetical protein
MWWWLWRLVWGPEAEQQVVVQEAAQLVAPHRPLAHLGADDNAAAPAAGGTGALVGREQPGLSGHHPQHQELTLKSPGLAVKPVEDPLALQAVLAGQDHG